MDGQSSYTGNRLFIGRMQLANPGQIGYNSAVKIKTQSGW
ncbi:hypothetical protein CLOSTMETH_00394 [[Clostridium] methylpentosum DSM 5476]|uniref:Uncharacterized protein n=1 Tax=[Clostridium] methylpentosum DSM 5476 TaxID=537013 RepID=C0E996_9FIRM|nr:hypothetical protein CLOSTMETH_00394 [[Clostridium] methylpentosum DSM 5476]